MDLTDQSQLRAVRRRLQIGEADVLRIIEKVGNCIASVEKEAALLRASRSTNKAVSPVALPMGPPNITDRRAQ